MLTSLVFAFVGIALFVLGLRGALLHPAILGRVLAINVSGAGVFLVLVSLAYRGPRVPPDPLPHALVLTGIVVAVSATALALALIRRLHRAANEPPEEPSDT